MATGTVRSHSVVVRGMHLQRLLMGIPDPEVTELVRATGRWWKLPIRCLLHVNEIQKLQLSMQECYDANLVIPVTRRKNLVVGHWGN